MPMHESTDTPAATEAHLRALMRKYGISIPPKADGAWSGWAVTNPSAEEVRTLAKHLSASNVLGTAMNVTSESDTYQEISRRSKPEDFPEELNIVARKVLWRDDWESDIPGLRRRLVGEGYGNRIRHGSLLTELYWEYYTPSWRADLDILLLIRVEEKQVAQAQARIRRLS